MPILLAEREFHESNLSCVNCSKPIRLEELQKVLDEQATRLAISRSPTSVVEVGM
jgi:hypothetical protein